MIKQFQPCGMGVPPMFLYRAGAAAFLFSCAFLLACQGTSRPADAASTPTPAAPAPPSPFAKIPADELGSLLADMARAHDQKHQLSFYVALPWQGVTKPYSDFYSKMGDQQAALSKELQAWAKAHKVDLTYHPTDDTAGRALKIMEDRQEKIIRGDSKADFTRDTLIQMYTDYEWQISVLQALLPQVTDPALRAYLTKSLKIHEDGSAELAALLKRFKST